MTTDRQVTRFDDSNTVMAVSDQAGDCNVHISVIDLIVDNDFYRCAQSIRD